MTKKGTGTDEETGMLDACICGTGKNRNFRKDVSYDRIYIQTSMIRQRCSFTEIRSSHVQRWNRS